MNYYFFILKVILLAQLLDNVYGHGRLIDPASRSSAWRFGWPTPKNYDDNQLYSGGFEVLINS